jgi:hypothetical protein
MAARKLTMFQIHIEAISMPDSRLKIIRAPERAGKQWQRARQLGRVCQLADAGG